MTAAFALSLNFVSHVCGECGVAFAFSETVYNARVKDQKTFFCPNGHERHFVGETEEQRLKKLLESERARVEWWRQRSIHKDRQLSATKGQITKIKNRVGNGVCPCCNRTFQNLMRHMATKHPEYKDAE